ncbi:MAG: hypothetical protein ACI8Z1_002300 [Candidatus Azotimanducaceae bacterium]|jgi:hypothetical protein
MTSLFDAVREICLGLPETEEVLSSGLPKFKVAGKAFATYSMNHHGDGKVALLVSLSRDMQQMLIASAPRHFYVQPYIGNKGWAGIELNQGIKWKRVAQLATDAYRKVAPKALAESAQAAGVKAPTEPMKPEDVNPLDSKTNQDLLKKLTRICDPLPEVSKSTQFGAPCFRAGKKTFAHCSSGRSTRGFKSGWEMSGNLPLPLLTNAIVFRHTSATTAGSGSTFQANPAGKR